ncbi:MAG: response regulator [Usitatibacteraceae bacterium]
MMADKAAAVLLVEDSPADRELILRAIERAKFKEPVQVACDGAEALDYLFCRAAFSGREIQDCPKVIFLDLKLPKVNGLEVLRQIKADPRTKAVPVVMLTSSQERNDLLASQGLGVNSYVVKPVNFSAFDDTIGKLCHYWLSVNEPPQV